MIRYYNPEPPIEPKEDAPVGYCEHCKCELYNDDYIYDGNLVCKDCYEEAIDLATTMEYIKAYPERFFDYLLECYICTDKIHDMIVAVLEDYREQEQTEYNTWVMS